MASATVRYIVDDVDAAIEFYAKRLGFHEDMHPAPTFAMLSRGDLRLVLSAPGGPGGGGQAMPDGRVPEPGGWNRFSLEVPDLAGAVDDLRQAGSTSGTTSSRASAASRSSSTIRQVTRSSCSSPRRADRGHSPVTPSMFSRIRSAWPLWRAVSSIMCSMIQRRLNGSPLRDGFAATRSRSPASAIAARLRSQASA
jgi:Glyoxalase/Bleomycin resistance protein/Dioxygenase superfamily